MLVLAPDPRLGIAPERIARLRALLGAVSVEDGVEPASGAAVPGVVVALPGGESGSLDAVVLRPDGILGLVPTLTRARVGAPVGGGGDAPADPDGERELDRLLALPDPACAAPRRLLGGVPEGTAAQDAASVARSADLEDARTALTGPVGSFRAVGVADVRRILEAFRLGEHVPDDAALARAGFVDGRTATGATSSPAIPPPAAPPSGESAGAPRPAEPAAPAPSVPEARRAPSSGPVPSPERAPITAPLRALRSGASRGGDPRPGLPATGRLSGLVAPGRRARTAGWGADLRDRVTAWSPPHLPSWATGYRGLAVAALVAFLLALTLALAMGRSSSPDPAPVNALTRVVDGTTFTRAVSTTESTCQGHAYGQAAQFLAERPCLRLERALWTATVDGRQVVVALAMVQMADATSAGALKSLIDTPGTGNVADLLRENRGYPGAPPRLTDAGYASTLLGDSAVFSEADRVDGATMSEADLDRVSRTGLALR